MGLMLKILLYEINAHNLFLSIIKFNIKLLFIINCFLMK